MNGITGFAPISNFQKVEVQNSQTASDVNFLNSLMEIAQANPVEITCVAQGNLEQLDLLNQKEPEYLKPEKLKTIDDTLAEIEKILSQIKKEKDK